jgi:hypothetical protein
MFLCVCLCVSEREREEEAMREKGSTDTLTALTPLTTLTNEGGNDTPQPSTSTPQSVPSVPHERRTDAEDDTTQLLDSTADETGSAACAAQLLPTPSPSSDVGTSTDRDGRGRFLPGNTAAVVTGARSRAFWDGVAPLQRQLEDALLTEKGYSREDVPRALLAAVEGCVQAMLMRDSSFETVKREGGPLTVSDRVRAAKKQWGEDADRVLRHLNIIGLETKPRRIESVTDLMETER